MASNRSSGLLVLLVLAVAAVAAWFVWRGDTGVDLPAGPGSGAATAGAAAPASATTAEGAAPDHASEPAVEAVSREVAAAAAAVEENGLALVGLVVDERGQPLPGAVVRDARGRVFGFDALDSDQFADLANDPDGAMARVRAARSEARATATDAEGRFRLAVPAGRGMASVRVEARGYLVLDRNVARPTAGDFDIGTLQLERGAVVSGRVVDRAGVGIADALVLREPGGAAGEWLGGLDFEPPGGDERNGWDGGGTRTDVQGRFELAHVAPGEFTLRARHRDHPMHRQPGLTATAGADLRDLLLVLEPGAVIRGKVTGLPADTKSVRVAASLRRDDAGGQEGPLAIFAGVDMVQEMGGFGERSVEVDADGAFVLRGLQIGRTYRVWAMQAGAGMLGNAPCTPRLEVTTPIEGIELRYEPGVTVTFQVVDGAGVPIERLWVGHTLRGGGGMEELMGRAMARPGKARDCPDGRVTIANLRPKDKQTLGLTIDAVGYRRFEREGVALPRTGALDLGTLQLAAAPVLRAQVLVDGAGTPVANATVQVREQESDAGPGLDLQVDFEMFGDRGGAGGAASSKTDDEGRCVVNAPVDTPFVVTVTSKEFARHRSEPLTLASLGERDYVVRLVRGGIVEVAAVDAEGAIAPGQRIEHLAPDGSRDTRNGNDAGLATFERLVPGEHGFRIGERAGGAAFVTMTMEAAAGQPPTADAGWQTVRVDDGNTVKLQLVKPQTAQLRGVVRENGAPLANARIAFLKGAGGDGIAGDLAEMMAGFDPGGGGGGGRSGRSGDDGRYSLRDLPEGSHRLRITANGRTMPAIVPVELRAADNTLDIDLDVSVVRGVVRGADGQPLAGATVRVAPVRASGGDGEPDAMGIVEDMMPGGLGGALGGKSTKTDDGGRYELRGVQGGTRLLVRATAKGHAPAESPPVEVAVGGTQDGVDLQLLRAGRVKVTMANKAAFVFASAERLDEAGNADKTTRPVVQMLRNGSGTLDGLRTGRWRVSLRSPNGDAESPREVDVTAGETATVAF